MTQSVWYQMNVSSQMPNFLSVSFDSSDFRLIGRFFVRKSADGDPSNDLDPSVWSKIYPLYMPTNTARGLMCCPFCFIGCRSIFPNCTGWRLPKWHLSNAGQILSSFSFHFPTGHNIFNCQFFFFNLQFQTTFVWNVNYYKQYGRNE